jgi:hypothetical protein
MKNIFYIVFLFLFLAECKKDKNITTDKKDLSYIVYAEEILAQPITHDYGFTMLTKNEQGIFLTRIDSSGNKTELLSVSPLFTTNDSQQYNEIYLLPSSDNGNYIVYTFSDVTATDTVPSFGIIKTDNSGNILWQKSEHLENVNGKALSLNNEFSTADGGVALIFAPNRNPQTLKSFLRVRLFDAAGNNTANNVSEEFPDFSQILMTSENKIYIFPALNNLPNPNPQNYEIRILDSSAHLIDSLNVALDISEINSLCEFENKIMITGYQNPGPNSAVEIFDFSMNEIFTKTVPGFFLFYQFLPVNSNYLIIGAKSTSKMQQNWSEIYNQVGTVSSTWLLTDNSGNNVGEYNFAAEYSTTAISSIALNSKRINILATRMSFGLNNDLILIKTTIN